MATKYLWSGATGTASGDDWTNAYTTFSTAIGALNDGDTLKVHVGHAEDLGAAATFNINDHVQICCVDKDNSDALAIQNGTTQYIGHQSSSYSITITSSLATPRNVYIYGLAFVVAGSSSSIVQVRASSTGSFTLESCKLWNINTSATAHINLSNSTSGDEASCRFVSCSFKLGNTSAGLRILGEQVEMLGCKIETDGAAPVSAFLKSLGQTAVLRAIGCDFSHASSNLVGDATSGGGTFMFHQCKIGSGVSPLAAQTASSCDSIQVYLSDVTDGNNHYTFGFFTGRGSVVADTGVYITSDGAEYNASGSKYSWKIIGTSNTYFGMPFYTPWISVHHEGTSAITPYVEALRSGSTTKYTDGELWSEWSFKGTDNSTLGLFNNSDRAAPLASAADQTASSLTASDWTGEDASDNAFMKLAPSASITPYEIGDLCARVAVVGAITVYVDPQIRGRS